MSCLKKITDLRKMDEIIEGIVSRSDLSRLPSKRITSEEAFTEILDSFIKRDSLHHRIDQHPEKIDQIKTLLGEIKKESVHRVIKSRLEKLHPELTFKPGTVGSFFFGCYSQKYTTRNKYCDPLCAFSIPNLEDREQVCYSNVALLDPPLRVNNGQKTCIVHAGSKREISPAEVAELRSMGTTHVSVYRPGESKSLVDLELPTEPQRIELPASRATPTDYATLNTADYPVATGLTIAFLLIAATGLVRRIDI